MLQKETCEIAEIHIDWEGPFQANKPAKSRVDKSEDSLPKNVYQLNDPKKDYGIYQIYGYHPVYGADTLLYIGIAQDRTFAVRIPEHPEIKCYKYWTSDSVSVHVGRLIRPKEPSDKDWSERIRLAEKLLIYAHSPARNSKELKELKELENEGSELFDIHVFNWGKHKRLLPEVFGRRYTLNYPRPENYKIYSL